MAVFDRTSIKLSSRPQGPARGKVKQLVKFTSSNKKWVR